MTEPSPSCFGCRHFYVTWDARMPRGCRALGFKSSELPSSVVRQSSGIDCLRFEPRKQKDGVAGSRER